ncbi:Bone morphogenetic protein 8A [Saguinus oedipus]|uniref:Bone morphogenetic protein 8A n=1 Tax=Saguinus oedipus TaxID=9490 RepID=A0ABQ9VAW7_SAGOE|nr:Bone morphogenetic protein 8A [Saguinus oedipus]
MGVLGCGAWSLLSTARCRAQGVPGCNSPSGLFTPQGQAWNTRLKWAKLAPPRPPGSPCTLSSGQLRAVAHTGSAHSRARAIPSASPALLCLLVERDRALGHQEPHWKEFHFDLTQIPAGEAVTAAEFRIYKVPSTHLLNSTLHVSMFQVLQEQFNRESDLFFLDLQTLGAGDEDWLVLDITAASDRWLLKRHKDLGLRLYVETEDGSGSDLLWPWVPGLTSCDCRKGQ